MRKERRHSRQREHIYQLVASSKSHPSAEDVYSAAKEHITTLSLGTVYRNLRLLVDEGKLREVTVEGSAVTRFDGMTEEHEHFICTTCGKIKDLELTLHETEYQNVSARLEGDIITSHKLSYFGICKECSALR